MVCLSSGGGGSVSPGGDSTKEDDGAEGCGFGCWVGVRLYMLGWMVDGGRDLIP
jgi:hypothetical protein